MANSRKQFILIVEDLKNLNILYCKLYNILQNDVEITSCCWKYSGIQMNGKQLGIKSNLHLLHLFLAFWKSELFGESITAGSLLIHYEQPR